jgi:hypothetical protein
VIAGVMAVSVLLPLVVSPPRLLDDSARSTQTRQLPAA